jgi:TRAP-type mannitol/chloroaromatic compound transport system permease small subunit
MGPIKTALPVGIIFLLIQGISELLKSIYAATRGRWP